MKKSNQLKNDLISVCLENYFLFCFTSFGAKKAEEAVS
jgi:hypothetical protein